MLASIINPWPEMFLLYGVAIISAFVASRFFRERAIAVLFGCTVALWTSFQWMNYLLEYGMSFGILYPLTKSFSVNPWSVEFWQRFPFSTIFSGLLLPGCFAYVATRLGHPAAGRPSGKCSVSDSCPSCNATSFKRVSDWSVFTLRSARECTDCDQRYLPPVPKWVTVTSIVAGAVVFLGSLVAGLDPGSTFFGDRVDGIVRIKCWIIMAWGALFAGLGIKYLHRHGDRGTH